MRHVLPRDRVRTVKLAIADTIRRFVLRQRLLCITPTVRQESGSDHHDVFQSALLGQPGSFGPIPGSHYLLRGLRIVCAPFSTSTVRGNPFRSQLVHVRLVEEISVKRLIDQWEGNVGGVDDAYRGEGDDLRWLGHGAYRIEEARRDEVGRVDNKTFGQAESRCRAACGGE